jgi:hypothetical protein
MKALRGLRNTADHAPNERALPLFVRPGVEVVRNQREGEPGFLRSTGIPDKSFRPVLLARKSVAEFGHAAFFRIAVERRRALVARLARLTTAVSNREMYAPPTGASIPSRSSPIA